MGTGYRKPGTRKTSNCEYEFGADFIDARLGNSMHAFLLDLPSLDFAALIPKGDHVTMCLIGDKISSEFVADFVKNPAVKNLLPESMESGALCRCSPQATLCNGLHPYGDRLVMLGDCGVARLNKDGIGSAYRVAKTAAVKWYAGFNKADGDQNQQVNIADITPIGQKFMKRWSGAGAVWACLPADYDGNTEVNLGDITPIGQNFQATANTFLVEAGDDTAAAPTAVTTVTWDSATPPDGTAADGVLAKVFKSWQVDFTSSSPFTYTQLKALDTNSNNLVNVYVTPQDSASPPVKGATATMTISVAPSAVTITSIDLSFAGSDTWLKSGSDYALLVTELSADSVAGNGEIFAAAPFAPEKIQLVATCESAEDPGVPFDGTGNVIFYIQSGEGLATVGNGGIAPKGELAFKDRGIVTIAAHAPGNFLIEDTITFRLFSIDSLALELAAGGSGPVNVNAGQSVPFKVTGTFDFDTTVNGNELTQDLTQFCNWGALVNPATSPITFDSGVGSLDTAGAASGAEYQVTCEFPKTDNVLIYDNLKRYSNFLVVNIN